VSLRRQVIAIDGPAGTGKSTVARRLAQRLGLPYLDTGAMYRALGLKMLAIGVDPDDRRAVAASLPATRIALRPNAGGQVDVLLDGVDVGERIRAPEVALATSKLAVHPEVRERMVALQRDLAARLGGVIEGRDIGTRVVPEANFKFFLEASAAVRARRRLADLRAAGRDGASEEEVAAELADRDARDRTRAHSPLEPAPDAVRVDTSDSTVDEVLERLLAEIRRPGGNLQS
jgi:CMP/dCMP kinase